MKIIYSAFKQSLLVIAGSIIGVFAVDYQNTLLSHWRIIILVVLILIFVGSGLLDSLGIVFISVSRKINTKLKRYALLAPYEIADGQTSSWVNLLISDICTVYNEEKIRILKIKSTKSLLKYPIVINPYGGSYPEENFDKLESFNLILDFVRRGGVFVNIADIPFYYAYSEIHERNIDTTPFAGSFQLERSFFETLITQKLAVFVLGLEDKRFTEAQRVFVLNQSTKNLFRSTIADKGIGDRSPYIALSYGLGYFVFSTIAVNEHNKSQLAKIVKDAEKLICPE